MAFVGQIPGSSNQLNRPDPCAQPTDFLDHPGYTNLEVSPPDMQSKRQKIEAEYTGRPDHCKKCGSDHLTLHDDEGKTIKDVPRGIYRRFIRVSYKRYLCVCGATCNPDLPGVFPGHKITVELAKYIFAQFEVRKLPVHITVETGVSLRVVQRLNEEWLKGKNGTLKTVCEVYMGIDGVRVAGKMRTTITAPEIGATYELLKNNSKASIIEFLKTLENPERVRWVATDICDGNINAIYDVFDKGTPVIDKSHLFRAARIRFTKIRLAIGAQSVQDAMARFRGSSSVGTSEQATKDFEAKFAKKEDKHRKALNRAHRLFTAKYDGLSLKNKGRVRSLLCDFPSLHEHHDFLQNIYSLWGKLLTPEEAQQEFSNACAALTPDAAKAWQPFFDLIDRYSAEIWAYFASGLTNSFTEAIHSAIRKIESAGSSPSFDTVRNRLLFGHAPSHDAEPRPLRSVPILRFPDSAQQEPSARIENEKKTQTARRQLKPRPCGRNKRKSSHTQGELFT